MKYLRSFFLFVLFFIAACEKETSTECAGDHTGTWHGVTVDDKITLKASCSFSYEGWDGCQSAGTYAAPLGTSGSVQVVIKISTGGFCLSAGTYNCVYDWSGDTMSFDCGAGNYTYTR